MRERKMTVTLEVTLREFSMERKRDVVKEVKSVNCKMLADYFPSMSGVYADEVGFYISEALADPKNQDTLFDSSEIFADIVNCEVVTTEWIGLPRTNTNGDHMR